MIYEFSKQAQIYLAAQKYPVRVVYGPERVRRTAAHGHVVVVERPRDVDDVVSLPRGAQGNPPKPLDIALAGKATIYARSVLPAAKTEDHERECEKVRDALLVVLSKWGAAGRTGGVHITGARYVDAPAAPGEAPADLWNGAVYELRFTVPRGVYDRAYAGEQNAGTARPTGAATGVANRTEASSPGVTPATGCDNT